LASALQEPGRIRQLQGLVEQAREGRFLRYRAGADALREVMTFLYAECCSRNSVIAPEETMTTCC